MMRRGERRAAEGVQGVQVPATGEIATSHPPQALAAAHARLLADRSLQFDFKTVTDPNLRLPHWLEVALKAVGQVVGAIFQGLSPVMTVVFWGGVALGVALIVFLIVREIVGVRLARRRRARPPRAAPVDWRPEEAKARALLQGAFDEAVHLLLYRSIDDIEGRRPRLVRPALTSRDIAALDAVPGAARSAFAAIAQVVEASFFGGRPADGAAFAECRRAYEAFAFPEAWA
jgi:hypothetical protein